MLTTDPVTALTPMPGCSMKIFSGDPSQREVAENVKIGDPLTLVVTLDEQDAYGIRVTDCLVSFYFKFTLDLLLYINLKLKMKH